MPIQSITNRRIYQQIADQLRAMIDSGEFPPGSYLPAERELSQMFGVSRTSVREALIALEVVGRVKVRVGDGVSVLAPDFAVEVPPFSLLQARRLVEPEAAALAAEHASKAELAGIEKAYRRNVADNRAGSTTHPGDRLLHIRIADASGNPAYGLLIRHLLGHQYGAMFQRLQVLYTPRDMPRRSELEHRAIVESLQARDAQAARRAMRAHLDSVIRIFSRATRTPAKASGKTR